MVTGSEDGAAKIVKRNGSQWEQKYTIRHGDSIKSVAISADGDTVVTGSEDGTAKIVRLLPADTFDQVLLLQLLEWAKRKTLQLNIARDGWSKIGWESYSDAERALLRSAYSGLFP